MMCTESVSVLAKHISENKKGLSRVIFVNESYRGTVFISGVIIWQASKRQMNQGVNQPVIFAQINLQHTFNILMTRIWKVYLKKHFFTTCAVK